MTSRELMTKAARIIFDEVGAVASANYTNEVRKSCTSDKEIVEFTENILSEYNLTLTN